MDFGMWLDCQHRWGVEADYFDVSGKPDNYDSGFSDGYPNGNAVSRSCGLSLIRRPMHPNGLAVDSIGYPGYTYGRITVDTSDYFQSAGM